jgi:AcrR family transcriptional regulator
MPGVPPTRPALRARYDRRQEEIISAAAREFAARGYDQTTMAELARATGLATGALYHYFGSKEELLRAICDQLMEPLLGRAQSLCGEGDAEQAGDSGRAEGADASREQAGGSGRAERAAANREQAGGSGRAERAAADPAARLRVFVRVWVAHVCAHRDHMLVFQQERHQIESGERWGGVRASRKRFERLAAGVLERAGLPGALPLLALLGMVNHTAQWYRPRRALTPEQIADGYVDLLLGC